MSINWSRIDSFKENFSSPATALYRPCPICGSINFRKILEFSNFQFFSDSSSKPKRMDIKQNQCRDCYSLFLNPLGNSNRS